MLQCILFKPLDPVCRDSWNLGENCIKENLNRNYLGMKQTVVNLYNFDGNTM